MLMPMIMEQAKLIKKKSLEVVLPFGIELEELIPCGGKKILISLNCLKELWKSLMKNFFNKLDHISQVQYRLKEL